MCPTISENGIRVEAYGSGFRIFGPVQHLRLNMRGAEVASALGAEHGKSFQMGDLVTEIWAMLGYDSIQLLYGENTLLKVSLMGDDWFLAIDPGPSFPYKR